jgi:hypothetical protein
MIWKCGSLTFVYAEFLLHRVVFLVMGLVLMVVAHTLSESVVFYYGGAMTIGIFLVILIILFQVSFNPFLFSFLYSGSWTSQLMINSGYGGCFHSFNCSLGGGILLLFEIACWILEYVSHHICNC